MVAIYSVEYLVNVPQAEFDQYMSYCASLESDAKAAGGSMKHLERMQGNIHKA